MRIPSAAALMLLLMAPAYAQSPNINLIPELQTKSPEEKEQEASRERAYKESLKRIPDAKASSDPWGGVRSNEAPRAVAPGTVTSKTAVPRTVAPKTVAPKTVAPARPKTMTGNSAVPNGAAPNSVR